MTNADRAREVVRPYLDRQNERLAAALRQVLAEPIVLGPGRRIQFEIDPWYHGIWLCTTEAVIMDDGWYMELMKELPDDLLEEVLEVVNDMVLHWLADAWQRVGGPQRYRPAFAFLHGYPEQFDLEQRRWLSVKEAFGA